MGIGDGRAQGPRYKGADRDSAKIASRASRGFCPNIGANMWRHKQGAMKDVIVLLKCEYLKCYLAI